MTTILITALISENLATRLADALMEGEHHLPVSAAGAFEAEPPLWRFEAWFSEAPDLGEFNLTGRRILGSAFDAIAFDVRQVDDADWVAIALEDLPPVRAGRFVIHGEHDRYKVRPNEIAIEIEASLAFGTGHHPTTLGCLRAIDDWLRTPRGRQRQRTSPMLLDVGSGTGILALAFARAARSQAIAGDLDHEAVRIARENAAKAGQRWQVAVVEAAGTAHPLMRYNRPYPLVVANILAGPLMRLAPELFRATAPGGSLILSGLLAWQARMVAARYRAQGYTLEKRHIIGEWATLVLKRSAAAQPRRRSASRVRVRPS